MRMNLEQSLIKAKESENKLGWCLHDLALKSDERSRIAGGCFAIAQQHYAAIIFLLNQKPKPLASSAFTLLRPLTESIFRGHWVAKCATDEKIANLRSATKKQIDFKSILDDLLKATSLSEKYSNCYKQVWPYLSTFTHTYELALEPWLTTTDIEQNFSEEILVELLTIVNLLAKLIELGVLSLQAFSSDSI